MAAILSRPQCVEYIHNTRRIAWCRHQQHKNSSVFSRRWASIIHQRAGNGPLCGRIQVAYMTVYIDQRSKQSSQTKEVIYDDVIKWKHFPRYWPFLLGIHQSPVNSSTQRPVTRSFDVFFDLRLNKRLSKQSKRR